MFDSLTPQQKKLLAVYRDKWIRVGLCCEPVNPVLAQEVTNYLYWHILKRQKKGKNVPVYLAPSPRHAWVAVWLATKKEISDPEKLRKEVSLWQQKATAEERKKCFSSFVWPYVDGHFYVHWFAFYDYCEQVLGVKYPNKEEYEWYKKTTKLGLVYPLEGICIISDRPKKIYMKDNTVLHREDGPAIEYRDGWGVYMLNNIRMPKWAVMTPPEKIDLQIVLNYHNTDVQRELIRKVGYDRILKATDAQVLETWVCPKTGLKYTMREMKTKNIRRRYLCYEHASMPGIFFAKAVPPEAKTIVQMRAFQTGVFGDDPEKARRKLGENTKSDAELEKLLPDEVK